MVSRQKEGHAIWWLPPSIVSLETKTEQKNKNAVWFKNFHATLQFLFPDDILFQQIIYTNLRNMNAWRKIKWIQFLGLNGFCLLVFVSLCSRREDKLRIPSGWLCHLAPEIVCQLSPETAEDQLPFSKQSDVFAFGWVHFSTRDAEKHMSLMLKFLWDSNWNPGIINGSSCAPVWCIHEKFWAVNGALLKIHSTSTPTDKRDT